jgi:hypothetical protein
MLRKKADRLDDYARKIQKLWRRYKNAKSCTPKLENHKPSFSRSSNEGIYDDFSEEMEPVQMISSRRNSSEADYIKTTRDKDQEIVGKDMQPKDGGYCNTGSIRFRDVMADTSRTLINL